MQRNEGLFEARLNKLIEDIENYEIDNRLDLTNELIWILYEFDYPFINKRQMVIFH